MKKMLMLASVASMIDQFNMTNIEILRNLGYEVHVAANFMDGSTSSKQRVEEFEKELKKLDISYYHVDFSREITNVFSNIKAYKQVKSLMLKNKYEFVHCHSPIGGVCGRLAAHSTKTKVIYTAHGFHFFKGSPMKNWLLFYPVERFLARFTDILITINKEDFARAQSFKAKKLKYVPGIGLNTSKFTSVSIDRDLKRTNLDIPVSAVVLLSVGELNKNKNHETIIKAIAKLNNPDICYVICGVGDKEEYLKDLSDSLGIANKVKLLGFRNDISEINKVSDIFVFPSFREGLSVALMEAMASGVSVVCSDIRGNRDLIEEFKGGHLVNPDDVDGFVESINKIIQNQNLRKSMGDHNAKAVFKFGIANVVLEMEKIYSEV